MFANSMHILGRARRSERVRRRGSARSLRAVLMLPVSIGLDPKLLAHMPELHGIQQAPILRQATQRSPAGFGEAGAGPTSLDLQLDQAAVQHRADSGWQLGLPGGWTTTPRAKQDAVGRGRILAKLHAEGSPEQVAFRRG